MGQTGRPVRWLQLSLKGAKYSRLCTAKDSDNESVDSDREDLVEAQLSRSFDKDPNGTITLRLPFDKVHKELGRDTFMLEQGGFSCSIAVLLAHRARYHTKDDEFLFTFTSTKTGLTRRPLTKSAFWACVNALLVEGGRPKASCHSLRIGGASLFLRAGVPEAVVKNIGSRVSDAFLGYVRLCAEVKGAAVAAGLGEELAARGAGIQVNNVAGVPLAVWIVTRE